MMTGSPIDILFDRVDMRCTICNAPAGSCACWTRCACGWSYETGKACRNQDCTVSPRVTLECPACGVTKRALPDPSDPPKTARVRVACPKCVRGETTTIEYFDASGEPTDIWILSGAWRNCCGKQREKAHGGTRIEPKKIHAKQCM